jgi:5-methylcytosine-specific restriction endonuclease McrA
MKKNATKRISKIPRKVAVKPRCHGTMTESAFWSFIRSALRQKSRFWKPITEAKLQARRLYKGTNKRQKYEYQCNVCKNWFIERKINVDHITPAGSLNSSKDLPGFVDRLFCEVTGLQVLCEKCHDKKTKTDKYEKNNSKAS